jgi:dUTP pyrophosphatase
MVQIKVKKLKPNAALPEYATVEAAGADVRACLDAPLVLAPTARALVPTGIALEICPGWECQLRPRSGLALRDGVTVLNTPGTIDSDFRGEIMALLINLGDKPFTVNHGDRIAQLVASPAPQAMFYEAESLSETGRGAGGYGSTGK